MEKQFRKTIGDWLSDLLEPFKTQALANTSDFRKNEFEVNLPDALKGAFAWHHTTEGGKYWSELHDKL